MLENLFPDLWRPITGTIKWLALATSKLAISAIEPGSENLSGILKTEIASLRDLLMEQLADIRPFELHFTGSVALSLSTSTTKALAPLAGRVELLTNLQSTLDAKTQAAYTSWDLNQAWPNRKHEPLEFNERKYLKLLSERLHLAQIKANLLQRHVISEAIQAVKAVLDNCLREQSSFDESSKNSELDFDFNSFMLRRDTDASQST